ncbi:MAG TPA: hypothetical protein VMW64_04525 [Dehalococcoidia bacterium]|nr:hypothetical protein [Dehalococcoidia bacterium]
MGSWERQKVKENRVLLSTISPPDGKVSYQWARSWRELQLPQESDNLIVQGLPYGVARNYAVKQLLEQGFSWLFFLDSDITLPPNAVMRLLETKLPLIGCYYTHRFPPYEPCFYGAKQDEQGKIQKVALTGWNFGDIVPSVFLPGGACLIHRCVFERMSAAGIRKWYEWTLDVDEPIGISEDYSFSLKAYSLGITPMAHTGIQARHECLATCGVRGIEAVTQ